MTEVQTLVQQQECRCSLISLLPCGEGLQEGSRCAKMREKKTDAKVRPPITIMPTYIYETIPDKPGEEPRRFEIVQKMTDPALKTDPESGLPVKRIITGGSGVVFHGPSIMSMNTKKGRGS